jgi:hypothetical protein
VSESAGVSSAGQTEPGPHRRNPAQALIRHRNQRGGAQAVPVPIRMRKRKTVPTSCAKTAPPGGTVSAEARMGRGDSSFPMASVEIA